MKFTVNDLEWIAAALAIAMDNSAVAGEYEKYEKLYDAICDKLEK